MTKLKVLSQYFIIVTLPISQQRIEESHPLILKKGGWFLFSLTIRLSTEILKVGFYVLILVSIC